MSHTTEIIAAEETGIAGLIAIRVRCCGDPSTDQVLTLGGLDRPIEQVDADLAAHQARVSKVHEGHLRAKEHISRLMNRQS